LLLSGDRLQINSISPSRALRLWRCRIEKYHSSEGD